MTYYRNFRVNEKTSVRVPMMTNKGNYLAAADHELECDILQVGSFTLIIKLKTKKSNKKQEFTPTYHKLIHKQANRAAY